MKRRLLSIMLAMVIPFCGITQIHAEDEGVEINETNFPDANFRKFIGKYDLDKDNRLANWEAQKVTYVNCKSWDITDLTGIEYFTELRELDCSDRNLTTLDVRKNTALENLTCFDNQLTVLDVSKNTALQRLHCSRNQLTSLDVSSNTALQELYCENNQLTTLDLSRKSALVHLDCSNNQLTTLDLRENTALITITCIDNQLQMLDVSMMENLQYLNCRRNQIGELNLGEITKVYTLYCDHNQLVSLDASKIANLVEFYCDDNRLISLNICGLKNLGWLYCHNNDIMSIDVRTTDNIKRDVLNGKYELNYLGKGIVGYGESEYPPVIGSISPIDLNGASNLNATLLDEDEHESGGIYRVIADEKTKFITGDEPAEGKEFGFLAENGKKYWYENWTRQGVQGDPKNIWDTKFNLERGREIYDPESDAWYWLDAVYDGAAAYGKEVWMPYIYQDEDKWSDDEIRMNANAADEGMKEFTYQCMKDKNGKWVRYDENGKMMKGWVTITGRLAEMYPDQAGNTYYYDYKTGLMAKGYITIDGTTYHFDEVTGVMMD